MAKSKGKAAPHQMPAHPVVNLPEAHPAHNVKAPTYDHDGDETSALQLMKNYGPMAQARMGNDFDNDDY